MNPRSSTSSLANQRARGEGAGGSACMSKQKTDAYLLARDTVRRIQRSASLFEGISARVRSDLH